MRRFKRPTLGERASRRFIRRRKAWVNSPEYLSSQTFAEATASPLWPLVVQANDLLLRLPDSAWETRQLAVSAL